jgi:hypothetical protein
VERWALPLAAGLLAGVGAGVFAATLLATLLGQLTPLVSLAGLVLGLGVGLRAWRSRRPAEASGEGGGWPAWPELAAAALFGLVAGRQFLWLHVERGGEVLTWNPYNFGDLPLHITYIRFFAGGAPFWPENPAFSAARLQYPIGIDVWNAMLVQLGLPLGLGLTATGLVASALAGVTLWRWGGSFALLAFLFSGGVGASDDLAWKNLFLALFVTQRGFLFALPAGLLLLESWRRRFLAARPPLLAGWLEGVLWGTLALFHLHSFALLSLLFACWVLGSRRWRGARTPLLVALVPGSIGALLVTEFFRAASLVGWRPGWTVGESESFLLFLARNFTLYPLLLGLGAWAAWRRRLWPALAALLPAAALWTLLFFVKLQPWAWDNTKVMLWCYVLSMPALAAGLVRLPGTARGLVASAWLLPGAAAVADATADRRHGYVIYDVAETRAVCEALEGVPVAARIAAWPTFNHPAALCGHALVAGYAGHLWTYGIDPRFVADRLEVLMRGDAGWPAAAAELRARYLFWGEREAREWRASTRPWEPSRALVASGTWGRLYDLASSK